jgi:DNA-binding NtrC family response regulator
MSSNWEGNFYVAADEITTFQAPPAAERRGFITKFFSPQKNKSMRACNMNENSAPMQILFMGKDALWYKVLQQALASQGEVYQTTLNELKGATARRRYDLIVVDTMDLTRDKIRPTIDLLKKQLIASCVVLVSASPIWEQAREALKAGASDYITKSYDPDRVARYLMPYLQIKARSS